MNAKFTSLDCDDDIIMLERDPFTVGRLKELSNQEIKKKLDYSIYDRTTKQPGTYAKYFFSFLYLGGQNINFSEIQFNFLKDCQILKIGSEGWQKGKFKINNCISTQGRHLEVKVLV